MQSFDIVIIGGGPVGLSLACGLKESGMRIAVLENQRLSNSLLSPSAPPAMRVSAINLASQRLLDHVGAWDNLPKSRLTAYSAMEVWERDSFAHIDFAAGDYGYQYLGHIIENDRLQHALWHIAEASEDIVLLPSSQPENVIWGENEAFISLANGDMLGAKLVIGADGANSWLRDKADIPVAFRDYGQHALVATVRTAKPHQDCARQIFTGEDILAFLPLYDANLCSIVWSVPPERAKMLAECDEDTFNRQLTIAFDGRLGLCQLESKREAFPLVARYAHHFAGPRYALLGDAAHTVHPLAGQGVNLGFMDAIVLIDQLMGLQRQGKDIGTYHSLRHYERSRKFDAALMLAAMQGFQQLFSGTNPIKKFFRDVGLTLTDRVPGAKGLFVRQALGLDKLPPWLKKHG